jgi:hypothetical protein
MKKNKYFFSYYYLFLERKGTGAGIKIAQTANIFNFECSFFKSLKNFVFWSTVVDPD